MHKSDAEGRNALSTVDTALSILDLFFTNEELGTTEIARAIGASRSTAFRFLVTLEQRGYLAKTSGGKYRLGLTLFSLGMIAQQRMELVSIAHPYLEQMAHDCGETCHLAILSDGIRVMFIDRALGGSSLKMDTALGYTQLAHCTASGKAILAFQPEQTVEQYQRAAPFPRVTLNAIPDAQELRRRLRDVRLRGYASDDEEAEYGLTCFAMPLLDRTGRAIAAVSISGPTTRMIREREEHLRRIGETVRELQRRIG